MERTDDRIRVLACYDGSTHARAAIEQSARLFAGARVDVLAVVEDGRSVLAASGPLPLAEDLWQELEHALVERAEHSAREGAAHGRAVGLDAVPLVLRATGSAWREIVREAERRRYDAVLVGARGRSALHAALLGSVSMHVAARCSVPVVVVHGDHVAPDDVVLSEGDIATDLPALAPVSTS